MATDKGLLFYNGMDEILINKEEQGELPSFCLNIAHDVVYTGKENGIIWCVSASSKSLIKTINLNISSRISDIQISETGKEIYASYGDGIFIIKNKDTIQVNSTSGLSSDFIYAVEILKDGRIICASDSGIDILGTNNQLINSLKNLPDVIITHLNKASSSQIWASSYNRGVFLINTDNYDIQNFPFYEEMEVLDILSIDQGLLIATENGLFKQDRFGILKSYTYNHHNLINITSILIDKENNLWLGSQLNPLWRANLYFKVFPTDIKDIQCIGNYGDTLYFGTPNGLYGTKLQDQTTKLILPHINVTTIKSFMDLIWIGTFSKGIYVINKNHKVLFHLDEINGLKDNTVLDIELAQNEQIYVSTLSGVISITLDNGNLLRVIDDNNFSAQLGYSYVMDIHKDKQGDMWYGRDKRGVIHSTSLGVNEYIFVKDSSEKLGSIYSIAQAFDESIWLSSVNLGLVKIVGDSLIKILPNDEKEEAYTSIIPLHNNHLLMVRASSIDLYNIDRHHLMYYNSELKLSPQQPYLNNFIIKNNEVYFIHNDQVFHFNVPDKNQVIHPLTSLDKIEVNLEEVSKSTSEFYQKDNNFRFSFTGAWMSDPSKLSYSYILEGFDQEWRKTKDRVVSYPHLLPGNYTFKVMSSENQTFSDEPITAYSFKIKRSFYSTWWFYTICTSLLLLIAYFLFKRNQREKNLRAELAQKQVEAQLISLKSQLNPHFLFNSFNTLIGLIEEDGNKGVKYVEHLTDFYRSILEVGKEELIPLEKELKLIKLYSLLLKERFGDGLKIKIQPIHHASLIPPMTIQMLVENAVKHNVISIKTPLIINVDLIGQHIIVSNNLNLKISKEPSTNTGLLNIRRRFLLLAGKAIRVSSENGIFKVELPIINPR
jgi:ligand-binding sensor domain-containing protein